MHFLQKFVNFFPKHVTCRNKNVLRVMVQETVKIVMEQHLKDFGVILVPDADIREEVLGSVLYVREEGLCLQGGSSSIHEI